MQVGDAQNNDRQLELLDSKSLKRALTVITSALKPLKPQAIRPLTSLNEGKACTYHISTVVLSSFRHVNGRKHDS